MKMLLLRSILFEVLLVSLTTHSSAQEYEGDENSESYDSGGEYNEHPDYSKYYSVDSSQSAPLSSGFVGSAESSEFFNPSPIVYGESNKKTVKAAPSAFAPQGQNDFPSFASSNRQFSYFPSAGGGAIRDYFEEAQNKEQVAKQQRLNEEYIRPGPSYISHQLPLTVSFNDEEKAASDDDVERIRPKSKKNEEEDEYEYDAPILKNSKPRVNFDIGKSSSTVSQYPSASGLSSSSSLSPYEKYSFQPVSEAESLSEDITPFNPTYNKAKEPIETQSSESLPNKSCRRISNPSTAESDKMNCFVCEDDNNKSTYTQCSYASEKEPVKYYTGSSERVSVPFKPPQNYRYKRYAAKSTDPYYIVRERSRKAFEGPSIPEDYNLGFHYEPESYDESGSHLSYSEQQSEELKKNPQNCKKVEKKGVTCTVCHNPDTGGNYEQCSYTSEPQEKKYAYVTEKKYDSDDPEESKVSTKTQPATEESKESKPEDEQKEDKGESVESYESRIEPEATKPTKLDEVNSKLDANPAEIKFAETRDEYEHVEAPEEDNKKKLVDDVNYDVPKHFAESISSGSVHEHDHDHDHENDHEDAKDESSEFDEYHFKLFPELRKKKSENEEDGEEYQTPEATKHNVEEVLAEFTKKDRSTCKKAEKNGMTCYLCVDANKIQHEECMYVQESRPQSKHVAYHEVKGLKNNNEATPEESKQLARIAEIKPVPLFVIDPSQTTRLSGLNLEAAASEEFSSRIPYKPSKLKHVKKKRNAKKIKKEKTVNEEPTLKTPTEFAVGNEEGAYSAETKPVYSKVHGVKLPQYMLDKSDFEKEFDEFAGGF